MSGYANAIELDGDATFDVRLDAATEHPLVVSAETKEGEVINVDVLGPGRHKRLFRIGSCIAMSVQSQFEDADYSETRSWFDASRVAVRETVDPDSKTVPASAYNPSKVSLASQVQLEMAKYGLGPYAEDPDEPVDDDWSFDEKDSFDLFGDGYMESESMTPPPSEGDNTPAGVPPGDEVEPETAAEPPGTSQAGDGEPSQGDGVVATKG